VRSKLRFVDVAICPIGVVLEGVVSSGIAEECLFLFYFLFFFRMGHFFV